MTYAEQITAGAAHLAEQDHLLRPIIEQVGPSTIEPHKDYYRALTDSIIGQQLSVKAAASIKLRFRELFGGQFPEPSAILDTSIEELRSAGLSNAKANYIRDLAKHVQDGAIQFDKIDRQTNRQIIAELTAVKGIGEWTAHMFLIFCVGRLDVLAYGDLGIRNAVRSLYGFDRLPTQPEIEKIAADNHWHPYESLAGWYLWRTLDNEPDL